MQIRTIFLLLFSLFFNGLAAQTDPAKKEEDKVFEVFDLEKQPMFPGGESAMMEYLNKNVQYPVLARENGIQGAIVLSFLVGKDGSVSELQMIKDIGGGCGKEAMRVVRAMPKWTPGEANGQPVNARFTIPIRFKYEEDSPQPNPNIEKSEPLPQDKMWELVAETAQRMGGYSKPTAHTAAFQANSPKGKVVLMTLEITFQVKTSEQDRAHFTTLGKMSDYFYQAQFAPQFFTRMGFDGRYTKILSNRADFDLNADGIGKIGSLKVPLGIRLVLYSKKNFKGKKLEINAKNDALPIPDLSEIKLEEGKIKPGGKGVNWSVNTQSIKIILPKNFPEGR